MCLLKCTLENVKDAGEKINYKGAKGKTMLAEERRAPTI